MIGLDTNVLLRYFVKDDPFQSERATRYVATHCTRENPGFVDRVTLCEMVWVLSRGYKYPRSEVASIVGQLLATEELLLEDQQLVEAAVWRYRATNIEFPDALIAAVNRDRGCEATATFDRKAGKLDGFVLVS
jgi:predicted nucleic-acid-binding protein